MDLREYLFKKRMTLRDFANLSGYSAIYIGQISRGDYIPARRCAEKIYEVTNGEVDYRNAKKQRATKIRRQKMFFKINPKIGFAMNEHSIFVPNDLIDGSSISPTCGAVLASLFCYGKSQFSTQEAVEWLMKNSKTTIEEVTGLLNEAIESGHLLEV